VHTRMESRWKNSVLYGKGRMGTKLWADLLLMETFSQCDRLRWTWCQQKQKMSLIIIIIIIIRELSVVLPWASKGHHTHWAAQLTYAFMSSSSSPHREILQWESASIFACFCTVDGLTLFWYKEDTQQLEQLVSYWHCHAGAMTKPEEPMCWKWLLSQMARSKERGKRE
jgi:hypothetical protein